MRTVRPQPDAHNVQTPGFIVAMPGMMSSSGTKRMISFSGLPQLASAALVPEIGGELDEGAAIHQVLNRCRSQK